MAFSFCNEARKRTKNPKIKQLATYFIAKNHLDEYLGLYSESKRKDTLETDKATLKQALDKASGVYKVIDVKLLEGYQSRYRSLGEDIEEAAKKFK